MPITKSKVTSRINLASELKGLKGEDRQRAKDAAGEIVLSEIRAFLDEAKSPVKSGKYRSSKIDGDKADLFEKGDMAAATQYETYRDGIEYGVFDEGQAIKAYAHNTGYKGHPHIKQGKYTREFVAAKGKELKPSIMKKIRNAISEIKEESQTDETDSEADNG